MMPDLPCEYELDHIGVAVESLESAKKPYEAMGWTAPEPELVASENVRVMMFELVNQCRIELIEATDESSAIAKFLKKRGPGIHHICLRVKKIREVLGHLKSQGFQLIHEEPFAGAHGCQVAFVHPKSMGGVLVELSEPGSEA